MAFQILKKWKLGDKYDPENLFLEGYDYSVWSENKEELADKEESTDEESADKEESTDVPTTNATTRS